ncbi:Gfo/Idh/MocA family oxidoreductase [uncultured Duncaniella sp.]|uniref:Gfo/Idh/MocA family oxidoreductase n=1 Tax=uncultured Duncaniella sp. TaxID=2768039 RepID=UPI002608606C|nr:Gfo/Idh/MocA family oxidoreductase [uncultured Duncaniella sp.]
MTRVITYGTYDLLHYGHIKLLERAKALGDYLIVGVTADDFDKTRGKINVQQSLMERVEAVRKTGLADEIIVEEYEGQKIDDIRKYNVDIFTVGSDWVGKFDYLNEYCKVVYLDRTQGVSSSEIRAKQNEIRLGIVGESNVIAKFIRESKYVNGVKVVGICAVEKSVSKEISDNVSLLTDDYEMLLGAVDAVYVISHPSMHYTHIKKALEEGRHVLCESPIALNEQEAEELFALADSKNLALVDGIKTAYSTAYSRMILLAKGGKIGDVVSVDAVCTSLKALNYDDVSTLHKTWNSLTAWGPTALLPVMQLLGTNIEDFTIYSRIGEEKHQYDEFTKISLLYDDAVASIKVGKGVKSEGELIISGTKGYIYVPAPWWKTDYFEIRYENPEESRRYFFQLEGEGIRNEIVTFLRAIERGSVSPISKNVSISMVRLMQAYFEKKKLVKLAKNV